MSSAVPLNSARRTVSVAAADLLDADGVKTSFATVASPVVLGPTDFNGGDISAVTGYLNTLPRVITIARSSAANQYSVTPIVMTYIRGGVTTTQSVTPANDDGNDTLVFADAVDAIVSIAIPAQANTGGAFTIGVRDYAAPKGDTFTAVMLHADGNLIVQYGEPTGSPTDTIPAKADHVYPIAPTRVLTGSMAVGFTAFLP